jgi:hypothetical protein
VLRRSPVVGGAWAYGGAADAWRKSPLRPWPATLDDSDQCLIAVTPADPVAGAALRRLMSGPGPHATGAALVRPAVHCACGRPGSTPC